MTQTDIIASPKLRAAFFLGAVVMLAVWGWSLVPAIESRNNPNEDGFTFIPAFYGTLTFLPLGVIALIGGLAMIAVIAAFQIFAGIYNASLD
jgi:hypothetical protein